MENLIIEDISTSSKVIAITFDDGPNPIYTQQVLEIFENIGGKATFYMIGEQMEKYTDVVRKVAEHGHEVGNHTYTHPYLSQLSPEACMQEVNKNEVLAESLIGHKPKTFRPPYLDYNDDTFSILKKNGYPMIGAKNMDARDWEQPGVDFIVEKSRQHSKEGSILLFHDGCGDRSQTIEAVRILVHELSSKGFHFVTVSELLALTEKE